MYREVSIATFAISLRFGSIRGEFDGRLVCILAGLAGSRGTGQGAFQ